MHRKSSVSLTSPRCFGKLGLVSRVTQAFLTCGKSSSHAWEKFVPYVEQISAPQNFTIPFVGLNLFRIFADVSDVKLDRSIHFKSHAGAVRAIGLHFVTRGLLCPDEGRLISKLEGMRNTGDYDDLFDWREERITPLFDPTQRLLEHKRQLITLKL